MRGNEREIKGNRENRERGFSFYMGLIIWELPKFDLKT
jgi:hypothetical protein